MKDFEKYLKNKKIRYFDSVSSTNTLLKESAIKGEAENTIFVTEHQTNGRGRLGKTFFSPKGCGIYLSYLIRPDVSADSAFFVTVAAAVAMVRALNDVLGIKAQIKWVNDIYVSNKKLCGILTESAFLPDGKLNYAVLGIGINIKNPPEGYPDDFAYKTTNIENIKGEMQNIQKYELMASFINNFDILFCDNSKAYVKEYKEASCLIGHEIEILSGEHKGFTKAVDIDESANLVVKKPDGSVVSLSSGDVSIRFN